MKITIFIIETLPRRNNITFSIIPQNNGHIIGTATAIRAIHVVSPTKILINSLN